MGKGLEQIFFRARYKKITSYMIRYSGMLAMRETKIKTALIQPLLISLRMFINQPKDKRNKCQDRSMENTGSLYMDDEHVKQYQTL